MEVVLVIVFEVDFGVVDVGCLLCGQFDFDFFDFLNLLIDLQVWFGVDIFEVDYGKVDLLDKLLFYLVVYML